MCQHCCMKRTPSAPIPYACPLCPVQQIADLCHGAPHRGYYSKQQLYGYPTSDHQPVDDSNICKEISELYCHVVESKRTVKRRRRRRDTIVRVMELNGSESGRNQHIDNNIPVLYSDPKHGKDPTWTWQLSEEVLPVQSQLAETSASGLCMDISDYTFNTLTQSTNLFSKIN